MRNEEGEMHPVLPAAVAVGILQLTDLNLLGWVLGIMSQLRVEKRSPMDRPCMTMMLCLTNIHPKICGYAEREVEVDAGVGQCRNMTCFGECFLSPGVG